MMRIGEIVRQGLHYARTCRSLWLFGFFVGLTSGGGSGGAGGGGGSGSGMSVGVGPVAGSLPLSGSGARLALILIAVVLLVLTFAAMRLVSEGALIEGIARARQGRPMTMAEGLRVGISHWGVLLRIALVYVAATTGSLVLLATPCVLAARAFGWPAAVLAGLPALLIGVPWLVTLYLVQAFAARIAILENRRALDAIVKARLFLHGRLMHGLRLIVATFAGTLLMTALGLLVIAPMMAILAALIPTVRLVPVLVLGSVLVLPAMVLLMAVLGTYRSSIWTIGYVTQVDA